MSHWAGHLCPMDIFLVFRWLSTRNKSSFFTNEHDIWKFSILVFGCGILVWSGCAARDGCSQGTWSHPWCVQWSVFVLLALNFAFFIRSITVRYLHFSSHTSHSLLVFSGVLFLFKESLFVLCHSTQDQLPIFSVVRFLTATWLT